MWLFKKKQKNTNTENADAEKKFRYFRHAEAVEGLLKGTRFISRLSYDNYDCSGQGMAYTGEKLMYGNRDGMFIVHKRMYKGYGAPMERILSLPGPMERSACIEYEAEHQAEYSCWYDMTEDES